MTFQVGHIPAHKGRQTVTVPIKEFHKVQEIKELLKHKPRELALFTFGCNTAFRAGDILNLKRSQLTLLPDGRYEVNTIEQKTKKQRCVLLNLHTSEVLREHLKTSSGEYVFEGQRGPMSVSYLGRLMKDWARDVGIEGQVATHTLRKTFVRLQYQHFGMPLASLMRALNHSSEAQTLQYVGMLPKDVERLYDNTI